MEKLGLISHLRMFFVSVLLFLTAFSLHAADKKHKHKHEKHKEHKHDAHKIGDKYESIEGLQEDLKAAGMEQGSNLIIAIDYTGSNSRQGKKTYAQHMTNPSDKKLFSNLHWIHPQWPNPYQQAITVITRTLSAFDADQKYPVYGFGDTATKATGVFPISLDGGGVCVGAEQILQAYSTILPSIKLDGPTSFAPAIRQAIKTVYDNNGAYHILVILTDGCIQEDLEEENFRALALASLYPLSVVVVGVGDGPFDQMKRFDDDVGNRVFDNLQFVSLGKIMTENKEDAQTMEVEFARSALQEIPAQYALIKGKNMLHPEYRKQVLSHAINLNPNIKDQYKKLKHMIKTYQKEPFKY